MEGMNVGTRRNGWERDIMYGVFVVKLAVRVCESVRVLVYLLDFPF